MSVKRLGYVDITGAKNRFLFLIVTLTYDFLAGREGFEPPTAGLRVIGNTRNLRFDDIDLNDFKNWLLYEKGNTDEDWVNRMINRMREVLAGKEITLENLRQGFYKTTNKRAYIAGIRNLINYLEEKEMIDLLFAEKVRRSQFAKMPKSNKREIYLKDEEIVEGLRLIEQKWDDDTVMLYKLIVYSGIRLEHAVRLLENFDPRNLEFNGKVARYPCESVSRGGKRVFFAFMPAEFAKQLRPFNLKLKPSAWASRINPKKWRPPVNSRIDANAVRKWFQNFCESNGVEHEYVEFFMGHSPKSMGAEYYLHLKRTSWQRYEKIVDKFPI